VKEAIGKITGNKRTEAEGTAEKTAGKRRGQEQGHDPRHFQEVT
jgi:uncharacterized protein YjbJ (UPF0337 family)